MYTFSCCFCSIFVALPPYGCKAIWLYGCSMLTIPAVMFNWSTLCTCMTISPTESRRDNTIRRNVNMKVGVCQVVGVFACDCVCMCICVVLNESKRIYICIYMCVCVCVACRHFAVGQTWCCNLHKFFIGLFCAHKRTYRCVNLQAHILTYPSETQMLRVINAQTKYYLRVCLSVWVCVWESFFFACMEVSCVHFIYPLLSMCVDIKTVRSVEYKHTHTHLYLYIFVTFGYTGLQYKII